MSFLQNDLLELVGAEIGAASPITLREATGDKSVTLDKFEKEVIKASYPEMDFPRKGGVGNNDDSKESKFFVHPYNDLENFNLRTVSIVYPKSKGNELRLYFSKSSGFTIDSGMFNHKKNEEETPPHWYIYKRPEDDFPHIGMADLNFLNEYILHFENNDFLDKEDAEDAAYQANLQNELGKKRVLTSSSRFQRNIQESAQALKKANFICEVSSTHETFLSSVSGKPYVEGHHLIPLSLQDQFELTIDIKENIVALCPNCHRLLHHSTNDDKEKILLKLWTERKNLLSKKGIKVDTPTFLKFYLK
ncbi:HNH endonuclease [Priestia aryabhattai]|uniref:HNH endonuclease n=1 Tax=Priestia aryabhattai TaxID=412384 RepID=UPI001C8D0366|nr:HNH endonuclease [Priestia aryabhattai]MBY0063556.1 HNH endonuclease [Priestia aryabhattai]